MKLKTRSDYRRRRHLRLRRKLQGTKSCPRMCVSITDKHMYIQFFDDTLGTTLGSVSTCSKGLSGKNNMDTARQLGKKAGELAIEKGMKNVVFDRSGRTYIGRVKAVAEAAREAGLKL